MSQWMNAVAKGVAVGAAVTTAAYVMSARKNKGKMVKKYASKAMKTVGTAMENVAYLIK